MIHHVVRLHNEQQALRQRLLLQQDFLRRKTQQPMMELISQQQPRTRDLQSGLAP